MSAIHREKRIAVTGATGFIGSHVVCSLLAKGYEVHSFGRKPVPGTIFHQWDATQGNEAVAIQFDAIIHCAASATDWGNDNLIREINTAGTEKALAIDNQARFIHVSTASVYASKGDSFDIKEHEVAAGSFLNSYIESKLKAEHLVQDDTRNAGTYILRPHAVYGPGDTTLLPRIEEAFRGKYLPLPGGGKSLVSLTRVETFVDVILELIEYDGDVRSGTYNVSDAHPVRLKDALSEILSARGKEFTIIPIPAEIAWFTGGLLEKVFKAFNLRRPPLTRYLVSQLGYAETMDISSIEDLLNKKLPAPDFTDAGSW